MGVSALKRRWRMGRDGFTLVEALVALAVFIVGIAALMPMVVSQVRATDGAAIRTRGVALAQEKLEEFRGRSFPAIVALADDSETVDGIYTRRWAKTDAPGPAADAEDLKHVTVTVEWDVPGRSTGSVTLVTARARY